MTASGLPWWKGAVVNAFGPIHCRVRVTCNGFDKTVGLENLGNFDIRPTIDDFAADKYSAPWTSRDVTCSKCDPCTAEQCILNNFAATARRPSLVPPWVSTGPNSNTFASDIMRNCGCKGDFPLGAVGSNFNEWPWYRLF